MVARSIITQEGELSWSEVDDVLERGDYEPELLDRFWRSGKSSSGRRHPHPHSDTQLEHSYHAAAAFAILFRKIEELEEEIASLKSRTGKAGARKTKAA